MKSAFSERLSGLRRESGRSQRSAADGLNVSQGLLSHYENGAREPKLEFVVRACDYYGVTADYILGRTFDTSGPEMLTLRCGSEAEMRLAETVSEIFRKLEKLDDAALTSAAINYVSCAAEKAARLLINPNIEYNPIRDAEMKLAEASFLELVRRNPEKEAF